VHGGLVSNLAEDDMLPIEPSSNDGGNEELGTVAEGVSVSVAEIMVEYSYLRVRSSIGHGEKTWLCVSPLEVLVRKLLAVDGLATSALLE
jgi:hypothetical protein